MGAMRFKVDPSVLAKYPESLRKATIIGMDRTPARMTVELREGIMSCVRDGTESGRLNIPWPVDGAGLVTLSSATLSERVEPYDLAVELARGRLNDARTQAADWQQVGLQLPDQFESLMSQSRAAFVKSALAGGDLSVSFPNAQASLALSWRGAHLLAEAYVEQIINTRRQAGKLTTLSGFSLSQDPTTVPGLSLAVSAANSVQLNFSWRSVSPSEGQYRWEHMDAAINWAKRQKLTIQAGPIFEFYPAATPDWLWLWDRDYATMQELVADLVKETISRYKGQVAVWHVVGRPASPGLMSLSEEQQVRITARALQVARQADPSAQLLIDFDRPWAEWMASSRFHLGPLHFADYLARGDLGLTGVGIEVAPSYGPFGSHNRDLFDFSKLLDLYALLNVPLFVNLTVPAASSTDPRAENGNTVASEQWAGLLDEDRQNRFVSEWYSMAIAKPYVRSVIWNQLSDAVPHRLPNGGLLRPDHTPRPILNTLKSLRTNFLAP